MASSTHSGDSTRPLKLNNVLNAFGKSQKRAENLAELDGLDDDHTHGDIGVGLPQEAYSTQPQKPLDLASLVDRVRQAQKSDPGVMLTPMDVPPPPVNLAKVSKKDDEEELQQHWYSPLFSRHHRDTSENNANSAPAQTPQSVVPVLQGKSLCT